MAKKTTLSQAVELLTSMGYKPKAKETDEDGNYEVTLATWYAADMIGAASVQNSTKPECYKSLVTLCNEFFAQPKIVALMVELKALEIDAQRTINKGKPSEAIEVGKKKYTDLKHHFVSKWVEKPATTPVPETQEATSEDTEPTDEQLAAVEAPEVLKEVDES